MSRSSVGACVSVQGKEAARRRGRGRGSRSQWACALQREVFARGRPATKSFAGGASLAYVIVDLMVELTAIGGTNVHSTLPVGPTPIKSLFAVVLVGATR